MPRSTCTVLIVEDFRPDQELYRRCLQADSNCVYRFLEAETAQVALKLCQTEKIDAILLDYLLPDSSGLAFLEALKVQSNGHNPPVVMITGEGDERIAVQAIKLGAEDYLVKGHLTPEQLQLTLRSVLENARLRLQLQQSEHRFRTSVENMLDCFGIYSALRDAAGQIVDFRIEYLNSAALACNCMTPADFGKGLCELLPAHREGLFADYCRVVETGEPLVLENLIYADVFSTELLTRVFDIHVSKFEDGFVSSWRDVTARRQAELDRQQQLERERILNRITLQIRGSLNPAEVLNTAVAEVRQFLGADRAFIYRFDSDFSGMIVMESVGAGWRSALEAAVEDTYFMETCGEDYRQGRIQVVEDIYRAGLTDCHVKMLEQFQICANLVVPILQGEQLWGLLVLNQCARPRQWQASEVELLQQLAAQVGIAVHQAELYQQVQAELAERQQTEAQLRESQNFIQQLSDAAPGFLYLYDLVEQRNVYVNQHITDLLGYSPDQIQAMGQSVLPQLFHPDDLVQVTQRIAQLQTAQPGATLESEYRLRHASGEWRWFFAREVVYRRTASGEPQQILGVAQEISDRKRLEVALVDSERRFRSIFNTTYQFIGLLAPDGTVLEANQTALDFAGLTREAVIGLPFWQLRWWTISPKTQQQLREAITRAAQGDFVRYEVEVLGLGETTATIDFSLKPVQDESGQVVLLIPEGRDISERLQHEAERQHLEEALWQNQERVSLAIQGAGMATWDVDLQTGQAIWSEGHFRILGYEPHPDGKATDQMWRSCIHPEDFNSVMQAIEQARQSRSVCTCEHRIIRVDNGEIRWIQAFGQFLYDLTGAAIRFLGIFFDATTVKQTELALVSSNERFELATAAVNCLIYDYDLRQNRLERSQGLTDLLGYTQAEAEPTADWWFNLVHSDHRQGLQNHKQAMIAGPDTTFCFEYQVRHRSGRYLWVQDRGTIVRNAAGEAVRVVGSTVDISDRKQAEVTMQQQLAQIEAIYATAPIGLCFLDRNLRFVQLNQRLAEINGLSIAAHLGRTVQELLPELAAAQTSLFHQVFRTGQPVLDVEVRGDTPAQPGVMRDWLVSYYPLLDPAGQVLGINIMVQEITERKRAELERDRLLAESEAARAEAEAANRSKDEFVALVAHELRSPLNAILGWAKLLQSQQLDAATTARALETITRNTHAQVQLVEDLLDVSRMVRGTLQLSFAPVNLSDVVTAAVETVRPTAVAKQIYLETLTPGRMTLSGDFQRLQQVVLNLLTNAIKFTPAGGRVQVLLDQPGAQVRLRVIDTGKGIHADFLPHVFQRFTQDRQNATAQQGLGLGLAIVKSLVELHGGQVAVESQGEGQGATFTIVLPRLGREAPAPDPAGADLLLASCADADGMELRCGLLNGIRALVIDDAPDMLELATVVLEGCGMRVQTATQAEAALELLNQFKPDIVLSDIAMPGVDGYELLRRIRAMGPEGQIPAVALTAYASQTKREDSLRAGFQQHLTKPVEPKVLIAEVVRLVHSTQNNRS